MSADPGRTARRLVLAIACGALLALTLAAGRAAAEGILRRPLGDDGVVTLLLLGSDMGPMRAGDPLDGRADAFHLLVVSPARGQATLVNVPRDGWVEIAGRGEGKINSCLVNGPEACVDTVEALWGVEVDAWFVTDFTAFMIAVDRLGGVVLDVPHELTGGGPDLEPGTQHVDGAHALTFVRDRKNRAGGDFARTEAQATFLRELHAQLRDRSSVRRVAEAVAVLHETTLTNANASDLLHLAYLSATFEPSRVGSVTLPGQVGWAGTASVVHLDSDAAAVVADIATDGAYDGNR